MGKVKRKCRCKKTIVLCSHILKGEGVGCVVNVSEYCVSLGWRWCPKHERHGKLHK